MSQRLSRANAEYYRASSAVLRAAMRKYPYEALYETDIGQVAIHSYLEGPTGCEMATVVPVDENDDPSGDVFVIHLARLTRIEGSHARWVARHERSFGVGSYDGVVVDE